MRETVAQKQIKDRLAKIRERGREYYWVKDINPEVYHGKPYDQRLSPRGHERAEQNARRWSLERTPKVEIYWTTGSYGMRYYDELENWRLYKVYINGKENQ